MSVINAGTVVSASSAAEIIASASAVVGATNFASLTTGFFILFAIVGTISVVLHCTIMIRDDRVNENGALHNKSDIGTALRATKAQDRSSVPRSARHLTRTNDAARLDCLCALERIAGRKSFYRNGS